MIEIRIHIAQTGEGDITTSLADREECVLPAEQELRDRVVELMDQLMQERLERNGGTLIQKIIEKKC